MVNPLVPHPPLKLRQATVATGRIYFGDTGLGGIPLDGTLALSVGNGEAWQAQVSPAALDAVQGLWNQREHAAHVTEDEALALTRAAVGYDLAVYGLEPDWDAAVLEVVSVSHVRFTVPVRWHDLLPDAARRATVRVELVDDEATCAEWVLTDGDEREVLEQAELDVACLEGATPEDRVQAALTALDLQLAKHDLSARTYWILTCSQVPAGGGTAGTCGELRVWTMLTLDEDGSATS